MSEHTPGPWEAYEHEFEFGWAIEGPPSWGKGHLKRRADAVLAAAAPELLEALEMLLHLGKARYAYAVLEKLGISEDDTEGDG